MYKTRLAQWKLTKHNKSSDMTFVLRKKKQRDGQGKRSKSVIHGKAVTSERIDRYFHQQRKLNRALQEAPADAPTPDYVQCSSDLSSPRSCSVPENDTYLDTADTRLSDSSATSTRRTRKQQRRRTSRPSKTSNDLELPSQPGNRIIKPRAQNPSIPRTPTSPDIFLQPERLFTTISTYISNSIANNTWYTSLDGTLLSIHIQTVDPRSFSNFSYQAIDELKSGSVVEGRILLSKACALLAQLLQEASPETLYVLDTFLWLRQERFVGIYALIQNYIAQLARVVLRDQVLWREIWTELSVHDPEHVEVVEQSQRCIFDALGREVGRFSRASIEAQSNYILRVHKYHDPMGGERRLRSLLAEYRLVNERLDDTAMFITHKLAKSLSGQGKYAEVVVLLRDTLLHGRLAGCMSRNLEGNLMQTLALAQFELGEYDGAEKSMRCAIGVFVEEYGSENAAVIRWRSRLQLWLREWGREEEADWREDEIQMGLDAEIVGTD